MFAFNAKKLIKQLVN